MINLFRFYKLLFILFANMACKDVLGLGYYTHNAFKGKVMGIFTSGGDSQGMNAAVRASVRTALYLGIKIYIIKEGYQGMVNGGDSLVEATWVSVSGIIHLGGSAIGSACCSDFRTRDGRLKAAFNLIQKGINNLIVIGGDGSLTGANLLRQEWSDLLNVLLKSGKINAQERNENKNLMIVGIVGSIDNDFCGTDMTIGTDSALHRIMEAIDAIQDTPYSHQHTFIMEVMGRHCGYLGLSAALFSGAEFLFIPEDPVSNDWKNQICDKLLEMTSIRGQCLSIVIVAEGAIDEDCTPISAEEIKDIITNRLKMDARITVLGHVQRGGNPSAFDRILACRLGHGAVLALAEATPDSESLVVSSNKNDIIRISLMEGVQRTQSVAKAMAIKDFKTAMQLRGHSFQNKLDSYKLLTSLHPPEVEIDPLTGNPIAGYCFAVMHIGSPACGMNAATRSFVRSCLYCGCCVLGIYDGIDGLVDGNIKQMGWNSVGGWISKGGSMLGTKCVLPEGKFKEIAERITEFKIKGILIIGDFNAYYACGQLADERRNYPEFRIPLIVIPATISNNIPGTEFSLGTDTALNVVVDICDRIRQSAQGSKHRVFIIETMGEKCGYLATLSALACGADAAYIYEEKYTIQTLQEDVQNMISKIDEGVTRGLILANEKASQNYNTEFIHRLYSEEGYGKFQAKLNIIGQMQQGGITSPFDRNLGTKMGVKCVNWLADQVKQHLKSDGTINCVDSESACLLGIVQRHLKFTPLQELLPETDFVNRVPKDQWWLKLRPMIKMLAGHESTYDM